MANTGQYDSQTNIETEDYEREIFVRPEAAVIYGGSVVNSVNGQVGDVILTTSDLENTSDYQTGAQVQNAIAGKQDKLTAGSGLNLDGTILSVDTNIIATVQDVTDEATIRENSDANLQGQIDALTVSSDVIDVLGTYQDLQNYDTSHVKANDIIKVLQDSTHNNSMSYYRWEITDHVGSWVYVGSEGPYYTKSEADALLDSKQNVIADLPQIRSGAEAGATAVQPEDLARIATTGSYNDSLDKPSVNNVALIGNKSLDALGIQPKGNYALESEIPDVSNFITNTVDNLVNYYKKSETFTKQEVNDIISAITTMDIQVVQTLPTEDISTTTIYFVPKTTAGTNDVYDEYIYVSNAWEHIGSTDIDLSGYQTKIDSSHKLSSDLVDDTNQTNKFVTENEKTTWNTEIENLQEEDELLKRNLQTTTGSGEEVTLDKTAELDFVKPPLPRGNSEQNGEPRPDNEVPITNVTGNVEVTISNENNTESKTLPVSLGNIELCKIGDYQDYLYKNNGKWYVHKNIIKIDLSTITIYIHTPSWRNPTAFVADNVFYHEYSGYTTVASLFCNRLIADTPARITGSVVNAIGLGRNSSIYISVEGITTSNALITYFSQNPTYLYAPLATPTDTEITDTTLISQLEEISKTLSYQGQTNITSNTIALFDIEAYQDLKIVLEDLDLTKLSTFDSTKTQILKNINGSLIWVDE